MANMTPPTDHGSGRMSSVSSMGPPKVRSRTHSLSSDRASTIGAGLMSPPLTVSPEAAFIAAAAASQIVTNDHDAHQDIWYDQQGIEPPSETVLVSPAALALINNFLDRLLFNLLSTAKSTSLAALRPAVSEVLKPKLAKDAIYQADEELQEYLGGGDDEDYGSPRRSESARDWDLELVWKRTRLRCMVYSSLGDLEEEDEDFHMEQENLLTGDETVEETISPAVAIFLTSVLEFMGEQALIVAGQAAFQRMRHQYEKSLREGTRSPADVADRIVVGDSDVERIALDRTLGRLWRSWKKQMRSPVLAQEPTFRNFSRDSARSGSVKDYRWRSLSVEPPRTRNDGSVSPLEADEESTEPDMDSAGAEKPAASVPLPVGPDDMLEILIPGLAHYSDDEEEPYESKSETLPRRPKSMLLSPLAAGVRDPPTPATSVPCTPKFPPRKRANSLPTPAASPFSSPANKHIETVTSPAEDDGAALCEPVTSNLETQNMSGGNNEVPATRVPPLSQKSSNAVTTELRADKEVQRPTIQQRRMSSAQIAAMIAGSSGSKSPGIAARSPGLPAISPAVAAAPEQELNDEAEEIEEFCEEPEILTTSRISVSGRSTSPTISERSKPAITIGIPKRSASVHSVRVIEVATPRSPMSRSRNSSADAQERTSLRSSNLSRTDSNNAFTPPIREEGARQTSPTRKAYPFPTKSTRLHQSDSISEAEESIGSPVPTMSVSTLSSRTPTPLLDQKPTTSYDDLEAQAQAQPPTIFTVPRDSNSQGRNSPATKVTIVSSSSSSGTFYHEDKSTVPSKSRSATQTNADVPCPPERSSNRPQGTSPSTRQASSTTTVSVERSSPNRRAPSQTREAVEPPRERSITPMSMEKGSNRKHHDSVSTVSSLQQRLKPVRASQDSTRPVDIKTFDELIQSDETIQYTLTPENMRDIDSTRSGKNDSPVLRPKSRKGEENKFQEHSRSASTPTGGPRAVDLKRSASVSRAGALSSHPINEGAPLSGPIPRAPGLTPSKSYGAGPQARDARIPLESLTEFADFIRATGPPGASGSMGASSSRTPASSVSRTTAGPAAGSKQSLESSGRASNTSNRARYQARDAAIDPREDNSDLIDFIRRGPQTKDNPRIPRTVAPFRNTMDSDQFATASGGKAVDATLPDLRHSAASTSVTENSVPSSINSQSALLRKDKSLAGARGGQGNTNMFDEEDMIPKRKQRRVRDPYAIDFSDEEDDEFEEATPKPPRRLQPPIEKEETLAEFLMNVPPPKETSPVPFNLPSQNPPTPKKKSSTASLISRFTRRDSTKSDRNKAEKESNKLTKQPDPNSVAPQSRAGGGRGYVPIQVNLPPGVHDYGAVSPRPKTTGSSGRVPMRKFEPREAVPVPNRAISELADFLRNSEPPRNFGPAAYGGENGQRLPKQFSESGQRLPKQFAQS